MTTTSRRPFVFASDAAQRAQRPGSARAATGTITLLLAYRHTLLRQALRLLLSAQPEFEVIGEAEDGKDAVEKAEKLAPDVVLLDTSLPVLNGIEATRLIRRKSVRARVLMLTIGAHDDVLEILKAGAAGCVLKTSDAEELATAIHTIHGGSSYLSPALADRVVQSYVELANGTISLEPASTADTLSVREREILQLVAEDVGNQEIARRLCLSVKTVEAHKAHIMRKLNVRGRTELIKYAIRKGLIELETSNPSY